VEELAAQAVVQDMSSRNVEFSSVRAKAIPANCPIQAKGRLEWAAATPDLDAALADENQSPY